MHIPTSRSARRTSQKGAALFMLIAMVMVMVMASCSVAADDTATSTATEAQRAGSSAPASVASSSSGLDCALLSDAFVANLIGDDFTFIDGSSDGLGQGSTSECEWQHPLGLDGPADYYAITVHTIATSQVDNSVQFVYTEPVDNLGTEGYRVATTEQSPFYFYEVKVGESAFRLNMIDTFGFDKTKDGTADVARSMLAEVLRNQ